MLQTLVDNFYESALEVLESDWLKLSSDSSAARNGSSLPPGVTRRSVYLHPITDPLRLEELTKIRQSLIPHLILRLHHALFDTHARIPEYVLSHLTSTCP